MLRFRLLYVLTSNVYDVCVCMCVCVCVCVCARMSACMRAFHLYCSAQLNMFNMEKRYRNKIIIIIIIIKAVEHQWGREDLLVEAVVVLAPFVVTVMTGTAVTAVES